MTDHSLVPRPVFDVSQWITLRFRRGARYYRLHLEQDLWGAWCLTRVQGRVNTRGGRSLTTWPGSYSRGVARLTAAAQGRRQLDYNVVR